MEVAGCVPGALHANSLVPGLTKTSVPLEGWKWNFPSFWEIVTDRLANRPKERQTDMPANWEVSLPMILTSPKDMAMRLLAKKNTRSCFTKDKCECDICYKDID